MVEWPSDKALGERGCVRQTNRNVQIGITTTWPWEVIARLEGARVFGSAP